MQILGFSLNWQFFAVCYFFHMSKNWTIWISKNPQFSNDQKVPWWHFRIHQYGHKKKSERIVFHLKINCPPLKLTIVCNFRDSNLSNIGGNKSVLYNFFQIFNPLYHVGYHDWCHFHEKKQHLSHIHIIIDYTVMLNYMLLLVRQR